MAISEQKMKIVIENYFKAECNVNTSIREAFEKGFRIGVKKGQSVQQSEQRWIPVTERLPEDEQPVIFSTKTGRVHQGKYYKDGSANQWYSALDKMRAFNNVVNAWMQLPEPYREGQE